VAYAFLKMYTPLEKCICLLGLGLGFWALVLSLWAFLNLILRLIIQSCIMIDKIVSSSRPGILNFCRYKMECLYIPSEPFANTSCNPLYNHTRSKYRHLWPLVATTTAHSNQQLQLNKQPILPF
jgi:hypothetical protein